jgi:hypothetical protein
MHDPTPHGQPFTALSFIASVIDGERAEELEQCARERDARRLYGV